MKQYFERAVKQIESVYEVLYAEPSASATAEFNDKVRFGKSLPDVDPKFAKLLKLQDTLNSTGVRDDFLADPSLFVRAKMLSRECRLMLTQYQVSNRFTEKYEEAKGANPLVYKRDI